MNIVDYGFTSGSTISVLNSTSIHEENHDFNETGTTEVSDSDSVMPLSTDEENVEYNERFAWLRSSSGIASKIMTHMGYRGKGLGKSENGIREAITVKPRVPRVKSRREPPKRKTLYILSDSMLNGIDEKRLTGNKYCDVIIQCHGGCTIECMYSHLDTVMERKPEFVLLHVGTNNCVNRTSDEVLKDLKRLKEYIERVLKSTKVYISLPTVRTDNTRANNIIRNLNIKLKKLNYTLLDNCNINEHHLGKKGLHFNNHGTRKMASNIISLIKSL